MKFKTLKTSETGKKFAVVDKNISLAIKATRKLAKEQNFKQWRGNRWGLAGGIYSVLFEETPDLSVWKKIAPNEYSTKRSTKKGKEMWALLNELPVVFRHELNSCINLDGFNFYGFNTIGFARGHKLYYGFEVGDEWAAKIPNDCEEITTTEYNKLFK